MIGKKRTEEQELLEHFILNDGKKLEPIEEGELFARLLALGWDKNEICKKVGRSTTYFDNMVAIVHEPQLIKNEVINKNISAGTLTVILNETDKKEETVKLIDKAKENAEIRQDKKVEIEQKKLEKKGIPVEEAETKAKEKVGKITATPKDLDLPKKVDKKLVIKAEQDGLDYSDMKMENIEKVNFHWYFSPRIAIEG